MEGSTTKKHKEEARKAVIGIITLSDSRTIETDESGHLIKELLEADGHKVISHVVIPDEESKLLSAIRGVNADVIITNGGTGVARRDITTESVEMLFDKKMPSFNALFAQLSYADVGSAALLSRATAGIMGKTAIFSLPGSPKACRLAMIKLILPEIGHIVKHLGA